MALVDPSNPGELLRCSLDEIVVCTSDRGGGILVDASAIGRPIGHRQFFGQEMRAEEERPAKPLPLVCLACDILRFSVHGFMLKEAGVREFQSVLGTVYFLGCLVIFVAAEVV